MLGNISLWQLLIVLALVVLLFGTKKLRTLGSDLGSAVKGFKKSVSDNEDADFKDKPAVESKEQSTVDEKSANTTAEQKEPK